MGALAATLDLVVLSVAAVLKLWLGVLLQCCCSANAMAGSAVAANAICIGGCFVSRCCVCC